jgi:hypothetical protein
MCTRLALLKPMSRPVTAPLGSTAARTSMQKYKQQASIASDHEVCPAGLQACCCYCCHVRPAAHSCKPSHKMMPASNLQAVLLWRWSPAAASAAAPPLPLLERLWPKSTHRLAAQPLLMLMQPHAQCQSSCKVPRRVAATADVSHQLSCRVSTL